MLSPVVCTRIAHRQLTGSQMAIYPRWGSHVQRKGCGCDVPACHRPVSTTSMHGSGGRPAWPSAELCRPVPQTATQPGANEHRRQAAPGVGFGLTAVLWYTPLAPPAATPATLAPCAPLQAVLQTRCPRRNLPPHPICMRYACGSQNRMTHVRRTNSATTTATLPSCPSRHIIPLRQLGRVRTHV